MIHYVKIAAFLVVAIGWAAGTTVVSSTASSTTASSTITVPTTSGSGIACVDKTKPDGTSDCASLARLCNDAIYYTLMTDQCPKTCGRCGISTASSTASSSVSCVDKTKPDGTSDCASLARLCNDAIYYDLMTDQCPQTCGRCNGATTTVPSTTTSSTSGGCVDLSAPGRPSDCPSRVNLCHNSIYSELMKQQCPLTCGYCTANGSSTTITATSTVSGASSSTVATVGRK